MTGAGSFWSISLATRLDCLLQIFSRNLKCYQIFFDQFIFCATERLGNFFDAANHLFADVG